MKARLVKLQVLETPFVGKDGRTYSEQLNYLLSGSKEELDNAVQNCSSVKRAEDGSVWHNTLFPTEFIQKGMTASAYVTKTGNIFIDNTEARNKAITDYQVRKALGEI